MNPTSTWADPVTEDRLLGALLVAQARRRWNLIGRLGDEPGFTEEARQVLYRAICVASRSASERLDENQIRLAVADAGFYSSPDGESVNEWMMRLVEQAPVLDSEHQAAAEAVLGLADRRATRDYLSGKLQRLSEPGTSVDEVRNAVVADMMAAGRPTDEDAYPSLFTLTEDAANMVEQVWARQGVPEFSTGSIDLDRRIDGFNPGHTIVIAARPSIGKTAAALDMSRALLHQGLGVIFFSLEMSPLELWMRIAAAEASVNLKAMARARDEQQMDRLLTIMGDRGSEWGSRLKITDGAGGPLTVSRIEAETMRQHAQWKAQGIRPGAFIVDYVQNVHPEKWQRSASETERVTDYSRRLSRLARHTDMAFVELSQLRRPDTSRRVEEPTMEMLRSSGQLEQDADTIILLHRPEFYDPDDRPGEMDYLIGKARHTDGQGSRVTRTHRLEYYQIHDRAYESSPATPTENPDDWK